MYDSDVDETQETAQGYLKINCQKYLLPVLFLLSRVSRYNAVKIWSAKNAKRHLALVLIVN